MNKKQSELYFLLISLIGTFVLAFFIFRPFLYVLMIILLSVLGGIGFFGPIGFLFWPLTISLLFALLAIYSSLMKKENP